MDLDLDQDHQRNKVLEEEAMTIRRTLSSVAQARTDTAKSTMNKDGTSGMNKKVKKEVSPRVAIDQDQWTTPMGRSNNPPRDLIDRDRSNTRFSPPQLY